MTSSSLYDTTGTLPDHGIVLMDHIRECVELAAQVRSAAPLQLVGHCLRYGRSAAAQNIESYVAQYQLDEKLEVALLQAGVTPTSPLPQDAEGLIADAILGMAAEESAARGGGADKGGLQLQRETERLHALLREKEEAWERERQRLMAAEAAAAAQAAEAHRAMERGVHVAVEEAVEKARRAARARQRARRGAR